MPQISLYMDDNMMGLLRDHSEKERVSISKYVAQIVRDHVDGRQDVWPAGYWENVYGCLSDEDADAMLEAIYHSPATDETLDEACDWLAEGEA